jgi:hypothetical protein
MTLDQNKDFDHYEITLSNGTATTTIRTTNVSYTLTFDQNRILFGTPAATVTAKIRSVDAVGNTSAYNATTQSATNPAPTNVASVTVTPLYNALQFEWPVVADTDLIGYRVDLSTTSSSTGFSTVYQNLNNSYTYPTTAFLTSYWVRVYAVDKFGTVSASPIGAGPFSPKSTFTIDTTPPANPGTVTATPSFNTITQEGYMDLSWPLGAEADLQDYIVEYGQVTGQYTYQVVDKANHATRLVVVPGKAYYIGVAARDYSGNVSGYTSPAGNPITSTADTTAPSQPAAPTAVANTLQIQVSHSGLKQAGGILERDTDYYEVYAGTAAAPTNMIGTMQASTLDESAVGTFNIPASGGGATQNWITRVKAVDIAGNKSSFSPDSAAAGVGLIAATNIVNATITSAQIGSVNANLIIAGTGIINDLVVKSNLTLGDSATNGVLRSSDYLISGGKRGFYLDSTQLVINAGSISAAAINISDSVNLLSYDYAAFEYAASYYLPSGANNQITITGFSVPTGFSTFQSKFGTQCFQVTSSAPTTVLFDNDPSGVPSGKNNLTANSDYTVSFYYRVQSGTVGAWIPKVRVKTGTSTFLDVAMTAFTPVADSVWRRYIGNVNIPPSSLGPAALVFTTATSSMTTTFDGMQIEATSTVLPTNNNFETAVTPWSQMTNAPTLSVSPTQFLSGSNSLKSISTANGTLAVKSYTTVLTDAFPVTVGATYQGSIWMFGAATNRSARMNLQYWDASGASLGTVIGDSNTINNTGWTYLESPTFLVPAGCAYVSMYYEVLATVSTEIFYADVAKFWNVAATQYRDPGGTTINGSLIRTGAISSYNSLTINGVTLPTWSIDTAGAAQFGSLLIRGNAIVGSNSAEGTGSNIQSYSYVAGVTGWNINSDGSAEFVNMTLSGNLLGADAQFSGSLNVLGSISANGLMGEQILTDSAGFHVYSPYSVNVNNVVSTSNTVTATAAQNHGFVVGNKLVISNVGLSCDGTWTVASTPSLTTFTFVTTASGTFGSTAVTGLAQSFSTDPGVQRQKLIEFPTDGTNPNIISGNLTADTLTVNIGATLGGTTTLPISSSLVIGAKIVAPTSAPTVTRNYNDNNLSGGSGGTTYGICKGDTGNYFIVNRTAGTNYIQEFNIATGAFVSTKFTDATTSVFGGVTQYYYYNGIVYDSTNSLYHVEVTTESGQYTLYGGRKIIYTFNTSWTKINSYTVLFEGYNVFHNNGTIGWDYVNSRPLIIYNDGTNLKVTPIGLATAVPNITGGSAIAGIPSSNISTTTVSGSGAGTITDPSFVMRIGALDGVTADRYYIKNRAFGSTAWTQQYLPYNNTLATNQTNEQWVCAYSATESAAYYDSTATKIYGIQGQKVVEYQTNDAFWSSDASISHYRWIGYSWYNSGNTHETDLSPRNKYTFIKRSQASVTIVSIPKGGTDTPDSARIYMADTGTVGTEPTLNPPAGGGPWHLRATVTYPSQTVAIVSNNGTTGGQPLTTGTVTFTGGTVAAINSTTSDSLGPLVNINGDGTWRMSGSVKRVGTGVIASSTTVTASTVAQNAGSVTFALKAGARYRATWMGNVVPGTAGQYFNIDFKHGVSASTGGTVFARSFWDCRAVGRIVTASLISEFIAPTTQTENVVAVLTGQGGTAGLYDDGTAGSFAAYLVVDEIT